MSDAYLFENARVKSLETKLIVAQQMQRLLEATSKEDAFKMLVEFGIGGGVNVEGLDFDALFNAEENNIASLMRELNISHDFDAILLINDYHNLKACIKAFIMKKDVVGLMGEGITSVETIKAGVSGDNKALRDGMVEALKAVEKNIGEENVNPRSIDVIVDKAMYKDIFELLEKGDKLLREYFITKVDYANILTFMRCKKLGLPVEFFKDSFIPGATLSLDFFVESYAFGTEDLRKQIKYTDYATIVDYMNEDDLVGYEVKVDNTLLQIFKAQRDDMFTSAPVLGYYFGRQSDLKLMKLIVSGIKNKVPTELIRKRMRELYA